MPPVDAEAESVVRDLARKVAALAADQANQAIRRRWRDVNALRRADRAPVWCRPVGCWPELLPGDKLICRDPYLSGIERTFRQILIKREIGDDSPVAGEFSVSAVFDVDPPNTYGLEIGRHPSPAPGGSWLYDPPLKTEADFDKLRVPKYTYNHAKTQERLARAHDLLGGIMPVGLACGPLGTATVTTAAAGLRGLTQIMMDAVDRPDLLHRLMACVRDSTLAAMKAAERTGLLTLNNTGPMLCSDFFGPEPKDGKLSCRNLWCHANSQEFDQVSPAMWAEFCLAYQMPIMARFGYVHYGCCENLTHKIDGVLSIPNLRTFTCSPWTDLDVVIEKCRRDYVIMWRQKATDVVFTDEVATIRTDLREGAKRLKGCCYQIVLRELQTLCGRLDRLHVWTAEAKEAAAKYA